MNQLDMDMATSEDIQVVNLMDSVVIPQVVNLMDLVVILQVVNLMDSEEDMKSSEVIRQEVMEISEVMEEISEVTRRGVTLNSGVMEEVEEEEEKDMDLKGMEENPTDSVEDMKTSEDTHQVDTSISEVIQEVNPMDSKDTQVENLTDSVEDMKISEATEEMKDIPTEVMILVVVILWAVAILLVMAMLHLFHQWVLTDESGKYTVQKIHRSSSADRI